MGLRLRCRLLLLERLRTASLRARVRCDDGSTDGIPDTEPDGLPVAQPYQLPYACPHGLSYTQPHQLPHRPSLR